MKPFSMPIRDQCELRRANIRPRSSFVPRNSNLVDSCPFVVALALPRHRYVAASSTFVASASRSSRKRNPDPLITDHCSTDNSLSNLLRSHSVHTPFTLFTLFFKGGRGQHAFPYVARSLRTHTSFLARERLFRGNQFEAAFRPPSCVCAPRHRTSNFVLRTCPERSFAVFPHSPRTSF